MPLFNIPVVCFCLTIPYFRKFKFERVCSRVGRYFYNMYLVKSLNVQSCPYNEKRELNIENKKDFQLYLTLTDYKWFCRPVQLSD